jgi:hypothetical protein
MSFLRLQLGLLLTSALILGCGGIGNQHSSNGSSGGEAAEQLFGEVLADMRSANVLLPPQLVSLQIHRIELPTSAEKLIELGQSALPSLRRLANSTQVERRMLAECCISIIQAKRVEKGRPYAYEKSNVQFISYTIFGPIE